MEPPFPFLGELLALVAATGFALANVTISLGAVRKKGDNGALLSVMATGVVASIAWVLLGAPLSLDQARTILAIGLAWFVLSGLLTTVFGRIFLFRSIQEVGVVRASALKRLTPFFSVILAWAILGEIVTGAMAVGMVLIAIAFTVIVRRGMNAAATSAAGGTSMRQLVPGPISAMCYAFGYITRKFGLDHIPDATFGTLVSSIGALAYYVLAAPFVADYRRAFREAFTSVNRWQLLSAGLISVGQISQFAALQYSEISRVVMITSLETFISMFFAVVVLKTERRPDAMMMGAAALATGGVVLVSFG